MPTLTFDPFESEKEQPAVVQEKEAEPEVIPDVIPEADALTEGQKAQADSFAEKMYRQSQSLDTGICVYELDANRKLQVIYFNDCYARLCGYTTAEYEALLTEGSALQRTIHVDDAIAFQQAMEGLAAGRQPFSQNFRIQRKEYVDP
jgi:hypothetical protein